MKQFLIVLKFELNNYFKNKSFAVTTLILTLVMVGALLVPTLIPGLLGGGSDSGKDREASGNETSVAFYAEDGAVADEESLLSMLEGIQWIHAEGPEEVRKLVESGAAQAGFVLKTAAEVSYVVNNLELYDSLSDEFSQACVQYQKQSYLLDRGLTGEEIAGLDQMQVTVTPEILGKDSASNYFYTYALIFVVYFLILLYGQMIATAITTEKSNRAIEILVTSVNSNSLIFGKVLAGAIAGVLQVVVILGSGFLTYHFRREAWGGMLDFLFHIPGQVLAAYAVFAVFSYLLYAFIYGILGALVSKTEDISKSATTVTFLYLISFFVAIFGLNMSDSLLVRVASYIPFTSGNAMFVRVAMGTVAPWEVVISAVLLAASCGIAGFLAGKLFRFGTLQYGNPIKFTTALKKLREQ